MAERALLWHAVLRGEPSLHSRLRTVITFPGFMVLLVGSGFGALGDPVHGELAADGITVGMTWLVNAAILYAVIVAMRSPWSRARS